MARSKPPSKSIKEIEKLQQSELHFTQAVRDTLAEFLGETSARLVTYQVGESLHDLDMFARRMTQLFGFGATVMLDRIAVKCKRSCQHSRIICPIVSERKIE